MKRSIICGLIISIILMSCGKADNTAAWVGVYNGNAGGSINRVLVSKVDNSTLKLELQTEVSNIYYTYVTLYNVHIASSASTSWRRSR